MKKEDFTLSVPDGLSIHCLQWLPDTDIRACIQIAHGMAEHIERYDEFAQKLVDAGFAVFGNSHRGHGKTAGSPNQLGYFASENGFNFVVEDMYRLSAEIFNRVPEKPLFLFGHSMGSVLTRSYISRFGTMLKGAILSGCVANPGLSGTIGLFLAQKAGRRMAEHAPNQKLADMANNPLNKPFRPNRTRFDWLSRDQKVVDQYVSDPFCGFIPPTRFWIDFLGGMKEIEKAHNLARVPRQIPLFLFSGGKDPVGKNGRAVKQLAKKYRRLGLLDVEKKLYPDARHEMLNENNREEVFADIINWIDRHL